MHARGFTRAPRCSRPYGGTTGTYVLTLYADDNGNGVRDPGEAGIPNSPTTLEVPPVPGPFVAMGMTDLFGVFTAEVPPGTYVPGWSPPDGWGRTTPFSGEVTYRHRANDRSGDRLPADSDQVDGPPFFGDVPVGESRTGTVTVRNSGTETLTVSSLELRGDAGYQLEGAPTTPFVLPPGAIEGFSVVFRPPSGGQFTAFLMVHNSDPASPVASTSFGGFGIGGPQPSLVTTPSVIDFGIVPNSPPRYQMLVIQNVGAAPDHDQRLRAAVRALLGAWTSADAARPEPWRLVDAYRHVRPREGGPVHGLAEAPQ